MALIKVARPQMPSLVDDMFRSFFDEPRHAPQDTWRPAMDARELEDRYQISFSMPGFTKDEIQVSFNNGTLAVKGIHGKQEGGDAAEYLYREIPFGTFERSLYLPENIDAAKIDAEYESGILVIQIMKKEEAKPKEISVKIK